MSKWPFTDVEYGKILDNIAVACVDVAVIFDNKVLLVKRSKEPIMNACGI
jgi:ADP-ribose pyrophosphatase YjhB (NUDIX family)